MRTLSVISITTGRKMPKGCDPSLNPHSELHPPHTHGMSVMPLGCDTRTSRLFSFPLATLCVMSIVSVVRPMS